MTDTPVDSSKRFTRFFTGTTEISRITSTGLGIGTTSPQARLDVRAQGALSTDIAFRVRNSADTRNFLVVNGAGDVFNNGAGGVASNTFYGENSGRATTGTANTFFGFEAGRLVAAGAANTLIGRAAGRSIVSGDGNTALGDAALLSAGNVFNNTALGGGAALSATNNELTAVGYLAGTNITNSAQWVAIGSRAARFDSVGNTLTTAANSVFIGYDTRANANAQTNQIVIGHNAIGLGSNTTVIGNTSTTLFRPYGNVAIGADTAGARLDVRAQGALSTDIAFRVRNSADTGNLMDVRGTGSTFITASSNDALTLSGASGNDLFLNGSGYIKWTTFSSTGYLRGQGTQLRVLDGSFNEKVRFHWGGSATVFNTGSGYIFNGTTLNASAEVQIDSTTKGFLPPRMTTTQRTSISTPAAGLMVYDTTLNKHYGFDGTNWNALY